MRTLIVLYASSYGMQYNADTVDNAEISFCHVKNFDSVKDKLFDTIIHFGASAPSLYTRKQFQTLLEE